MRARMPPRQKSLIKQTKSLQRRERSKCANFCRGKCNKHPEHGPARTIDRSGPPERAANSAYHRAALLPSNSICAHAIVTASAACSRFEMAPTRSV